MPEGDQPKPYKGPESYKPEDASLFFGRDDEAEQLVARIISSRFTLLHAQSGAGKTSLLNARVIPGLESSCWVPIRTLPQNEPIEAIRVATLQTLFPPLSLEREAAEAARNALRGDSKDPLLSEILVRYDALAVRDPLRKELVKRRSCSEHTAAFPELPGDYEPLFCRLLRGSMDVSQFADHIVALCAVVSDLEPTARIAGDFRMSETVDAISDVARVVTYGEILNRFYAPIPGLYEFFENIADSYGERRGKFGIVLLLDQFEELFTRFVDPGSLVADLPNPPLDWRLRRELFRELRTLYVGRDSSVKPLPIRYVISMRDEYIAQLDPIREFVADLDANSYHLNLLTREAAEAAVREPAERFGYGYSENCFRQIINQLTKEDRFIEPTHLQIVCDKLWSHAGVRLSQAHATDESELPLIRSEQLKELNGAAGILRSFFREFLEGLAPELRGEVLEMLELLVTTNGTRNMVERTDLTRPKFRRAGLRDELLSRLERRTIVRLEGRLGGQFAEITHEFLIGPILEALRNELTANPDYSEFRYALRVLSMFEASDFRRRNARLLTDDDFNSLNRFRSRIQWEEWNVELMLRTAAAGDYGSELGYWRCEYERFPLEVAKICAAVETNQRAGLTLTLQELHALSQWAKPLSNTVKLAVLRSVLNIAADHERDLIIRCMAEVIDDGST